MPRSTFYLKLTTAAALIFGSSSIFAATETGLAAVYTNKLHGHTTGCMETYDHHKLTAAHQTLPCGSKVKVTNSNNGKSVVLRINDRGPTQAGRILDISGRAAKVLHIHPQVMVPVEMKVLRKGKV
jgi:rare lipoprotein A